MIKDFHASEKYLGLTQMSPILIAKILGKNEGGPGALITMGCKGDEKDWPYQETIDTASNFGNDLLEARIDQVTHDPPNKLVTAPANMQSNASPAEIFTNVKALVDEVA